MVMGRAHPRPHPVARNGRPAAALISPEELASPEGTLDLLSDLDAIERLRAAQAALEAGDYVTGDELRARVSGAVSDGSGTREQLRVARTCRPASREDRRRDRRVHARSAALRPAPCRRCAATRARGTPLGPARRGAYRVVYRIDEQASLLIVLRFDRRATIYRPR